MNLKSAAKILSCVVILLQLSTVQVDLSLPNTSFGTFFDRPSEKIQQIISYRSRPAAYVSSRSAADTLVFVGDVLLARNIEFLMRQNGNQYPYAGVSFADFGAQPAVVGNFEAAVPRVHVPTPIRMIDFSVDRLHLPALREAGFTHMSLANNHSFDFGETDFTHTVTQLEETGINSFGHPNTVHNQSVEFVEVGDVMVAIIGVHTLHTIPTYTELKKVFEYASNRSEFQIVYVHWGTEYVYTHNKRQREAAERFVDAGADLVIGHHPHVVQDVDLIAGVPVFYSLGNYIFDQYDSVSTEQGLLLQLDFTKLKSISLIPVTSEDTLSQPRRMTQENHARFLENLSNRSDASVREYVRAGYFPLETTVATSAKIAIMSR